MQLNKKTDLKKALAAAAASLLASGTTVHAAWDVDTEVLFYQEQDDRVRDVSFKSLLSREMKNDDKLSLSVQYDSLTGASPTGAISQNQAQTFTQASGGGFFTVPANELPLDDSFRDSRVALGASYQQTLDNRARLTYGVTFSNEYDYLHLGANTSYAFDFDNNNRTLSMGVGVASDRVEPVGGIPLANALVGVSATNNGPDDGKQVLDVLLGFTQIINRRSLMQINYSASLFNGYLNDPYKIVSVLDDDGNLIESANSDGNLYRHESRPDSRVGHNLYVEYKYRFDKSIANLAYRYHTDDWGIDSHTVETRYRWLIDSKQWIEPNLRYYTQSEADFYTPWVADSSLPSLSSADYRLAEFSAVTLGIAYNRQLGKGKSLGFSLETYNTTGTDGAIAAPNGNVVNTPYPDLSATIGRINYAFTW